MAGHMASCEQCVGAALDLGYRMLDMAEFYGNETEVGAAIAASKLPRGDLYLASKCWTTTMHAGPRAVRGQVERTLASLGTDYLDLYLLHWPVPGFHVDAYRELQRCQREGLVRSIGVSNYTIEDAEELAHADGVHVTPAINQIEVNPLLYRRNTVEYFQGRGIVVQAYRALCDGKAFDNSVVCDIGRKHGRRPAQILGRWSLQKGLVYLPKSVNPARMQENMQVFDFELDGSDVSRLDALTGAAALHGFQALYEKCVVRDTPLPLDHPSVKRTVTCD